MRDLRLASSTSRRPLGCLLVEMGALSDQQLEQILAVQRNEGGRLGDLVVGRGLASSFALASALAKQKTLAAAKTHAPANRRPPSWTPLGDILVTRRLISDIQLQQALADQREDGGYLGELLLHRGWITVAELVRALSEQLQSVGAADNDFSVRERQEDDWRTLHTGPSFVDACDFAFDQVLIKREPERLEIVHKQGTRTEVAWTYERPQTHTPQKTTELIEALQLLTEQALAS